ncbi:MAG: DUF4164 family protein [Geminicoccaceae bacterium]|nr:DUF4164 family protein [Geminicoccaceae bacterium]
MGELEAAQRHLTEALRRLEGALARRLSRGGGTNGQHADPGIGGDVEALRDECQRLNAALDEALRERDVVRAAAGSVVQRLDGSIDELDRLLEGEG